MRIRNMKKADYDAVDKLLLQLHQVDVDGRPDLFAPMERYMTRDSFESLVENPRVITILAQERDEILGCCFVSMLERSGMASIKTAYIDLIVVDENHQRQGIGRALFQEVRRRSRRVGARRVDLTVWSHNQIAEDAYKAYGMRRQRCVYEIEL